MQVEDVLDQLDACPVIINTGSAGAAHPKITEISLADFPRAIHYMIFVMMISANTATPEQISS
jgi:hypothetical protein